MALRLRRGTDAERQLITPAEGELVYTTDTKSVYIGDGATVGGIIISGEIGLGDLAEVDLSTPPTVGQVLKWDGTQFVPSDDAENEGIIEGSNYRINIIGDDSSTIVDTATNTVTGTFIGDMTGNIFGTLFGNVLGNTIGIHEGDVVGNDTTVLVNATTNTFTGDGSGLINLNIPGLLEGTAYNITVRANDGTVMIDEGTTTLDGTFVGLTRGVVQAPVFSRDDSSLLLDVDTNTLFGSVVGDVTGSVFGDDSTVLVDAVGNLINTNIITTNGLSIISTNPNVETNVRVIGNDDRGTLSLTRGSDLPISDSTFLGGVFFDKDENSIRSTIAVISSSTNVMIFGVDESSAFNNPNNFFTFTKNGNFGIGTFEALTKLEIKNGSIWLNDSRDLDNLASYQIGEMTYDSLNDAITYRSESEWRNVVSYSTVTNTTVIPGDMDAVGSISAASFKGSLVADDSTTIIDGILGNITAPGFIQFGTFTKAERDNLAAINGTVIYNNTSDRFQGYQNGAWINLDNGTLDP